MIILLQYLSSENIYQFMFQLFLKKIIALIKIVNSYTFIEIVVFVLLLQAIISVE